ncbi:MAG TPA: Uma2 family endonuclease [Myxococcaceae bacterium]|jgi:Uma2 family endonuclease
MRHPSDRPATFKDLESVPENKVGEIIDGTLYVTPRPAAPHVVASSALGTELGGPFQFGRGGPGGWWILDEPELHLGDDALVPDLAGWRRERMPQPPSGVAFTIPPDWVCEVASPSTIRLDLAKKLPKYARAGVQHAWVLDPVAKTLQVFRRQDKMWLIIATFSGDEKARAEPFDAIELDLTNLWGAEAPPA